MKYLKYILISMPLFAIFDFVWLGFVMSGFYKTQLGSLARRSGDALAPNIPPAILVYVLMALGVAFFVLPYCAGKSLGMTFAVGALFGLVLYGVYDLTNYSILVGWTIPLTIADMVWGMVICGSVSALTSLITSKI
ncbi:MAG: DUF2177 domain-containing protein [Acidobacteria bacterium]|nr:MAG: DUF2177 domain-containing protein [Acidobacteriota bacterium]